MPWWLQWHYLGIHTLKGKRLLKCFVGLGLECSLPCRLKLIAFSFSCSWVIFPTAPYPWHNSSYLLHQALSIFPLTPAFSWLPHLCVLHCFKLSECRWFAYCKMTNFFYLFQPLSLPYPLVCHRHILYLPYLDCRMFGTGTAFLIIL